MPAIRTGPVMRGLKSGRIDTPRQNVKLNASLKAIEYSSSSISSTTLATSSRWETEGVGIELLRHFETIIELRFPGFRDSYSEALPSEKTAAANRQLYLSSYHSASTLRKQKKLNNPYIIFRMFLVQCEVLAKGMHQNKVSVNAAALWNALDGDSKRSFYELSSEEKTRTALYGPVYVDTPKRKRSTSCRQKQTTKVKSRAPSPVPDCYPCSSSTPSSPTLSPCVSECSSQSSSDAASQDILNSFLDSAPLSTPVPPQRTPADDLAMVPNDAHSPLFFPLQLETELGLMPLNSEFFDWNAFDACSAFCSPPFSIPNDTPLANGSEQYARDFVFMNSSGPSKHVSTLSSEPLFQGMDDWAFMMDMSFFNSHL